jgi:hypothetical protein
MKKDNYTRREVLSLFMLMIAGGMVCGYLLCYQSAYKDGQIDALTGKISVKLVTHSDSTKTWESK